MLDDVIKVEHEDAFDFTKRCVREGGIFIGISSGASLAAVNCKIAEMPKGSRVLTFCYDSGERYRRWMGCSYSSAWLKRRILRNHEDRRIYLRGQALHLRCNLFLFFAAPISPKFRPPRHVPVFLNLVSWKRVN